MTYHLGADYFKDPDGTFVSQPKKYISRLADTYKRLFIDDQLKGYKTPVDKNDHPELDTTEILEGDMAAKYLTMVGQLQLLVPLGRFDIHAQVATMSRYRAAPRQGHIDRLKRIYSYAIRTKDYAIWFRTEQPDYSFLPDQDFDWTYSFRYLGAPITTKSFLFGDNRSVVTSATLPHSTETKRHNILAFLRVREAIAAKPHGFLLDPVCQQLK